METIKFEGKRYARAPKVVVLPEEFWEGTGKNHMTFGVACDISKKGAVLTSWKDENNFHIHALPIPFTGHSLTNLMYGKDKRMYLCLDGKCYSAPVSKKK
jgi:hypothetical protein